MCCAHGCPMGPTRADQEPAYFWLILGANHMHCIKCIWMINQLKKSASWLLFMWAMFCCVMIVRSHPVEYQAEGVLLLGRQADLCVLKSGRPTELIGLHWQYTDLKDTLSAIHSWPCRSFWVDCFYNFDLMTNVAGVDLFTGQHWKCPSIQNCC